MKTSMNTYFLDSFSPLASAMLAIFTLQYHCLNERASDEILNSDRVRVRVFMTVSLQLYSARSLAVLF